MCLETGCRSQSGVASVTCADIWPRVCGTSRTSGCHTDVTLVIFSDSRAKRQHCKISPDIQTHTLHNSHMCQQLLSLDWGPIHLMCHMQRRRNVKLLHCTTGASCKRLFKCLHANLDVLLPCLLVLARVTQTPLSLEHSTDMTLCSVFSRSGGRRGTPPSWTTATQLRSKEFSTAHKPFSLYSGVGFAAGQRDQRDSGRAQCTWQTRTDPVKLNNVHCNHTNTGEERRPVSRLESRNHSTCVHTAQCLIMFRSIALQSKRFRTHFTVCCT